MLESGWFVNPIHVCCRCLTAGKEVSAEELEKKEEELPEYQDLHQMVVRRIGEICRIVNQVGTAALCTLHHRLFDMKSFVTVVKGASG